MSEDQRLAGGEYRRATHVPQITPGPQTAQNSLQSGR
jgi:hypothetical protein